MPKVAQYETTPVRRQIVSQPTAQAAPAAAFGQPLAEGIVDLAVAAAETKQRVDTTSAEEALVSFERDKNEMFFNPDNGYFNTQGRDAYDASPAAKQALEDLKLQYGDNLNENAKSLFDKSADVHITRSSMDINRHAQKGLQAWEVSTLESQVENSVENASLYWNDPDRLKVQNVVGRKAIIDSSEMLGLSPEATAEKLQTFESTFARASVEAATQSSSTEGKLAMEEYGDKLEGPDKLKMDKLIAAKAKTEKTQSDARLAVATATNLNDQYDNRNDIIEEVKKIEDEELQKKTMTEAMSQFSRKKTAESEARASAFEDAEKFLFNGGSAEEYKVSNPEQWELLSPKQQRNIQSGKLASTDWKLFSDLMTLPKDKLAKVDPTEHFDRLAEGERSKLISAVKTAKGTGSSKDKVDSQAGRTRSAQTTSAAEQIFGKKTKWIGKKLEQANAFYATLDAEVNAREQELDRRLTSEEYTNVLAGFTRTVVQEGLIFDTEFDLTDIPAEDVPVLSKFLRDNNVPVTTDNLIKAFKQASE